MGSLVSLAPEHPCSMLSKGSVETPCSLGKYHSWPSSPCKLFRSGYQFRNRPPSSGFGTSPCFIQCIGSVRKLLGHELSCRALNIYLVLLLGIHLSYYPCEYVIVYVLPFISWLCEYFPSTEMQSCFSESFLATKIHKFTHSTLFFLRQFFHHVCHREVIVLLI